MASELLSKVTKFLGCQFEYGKEGENRKFDCYGLCRAVYREFGKELPEFKHVVEDILVHESIEKAKPMFEKIDKPEPLCLVTFRIRGKLVCHLGVVLEPPYFIHIMEKRNVTIERLDNPIWSKRIEGFYRWKGKSD